MTRSVAPGPSPESRASAARCSSAVSVSPVPSLARPSSSQLSLSMSDIAGSENRRMRGLSAVPATITPTRTSRFGRVASMSRRGFSIRPTKVSVPRSMSSFCP
jgi:hypothetical protein